MLDARKRRIAENEARFREINDRLNEDLRSLALADGETTDFVCECGMIDCTLSVSLTLGEYGRIREDSMQFTVLPGHEIPDAEDVVSRTDRFVVVRKHADATPVVGG